MPSYPPTEDDLLQALREVARDHFAPEPYRGASPAQIAEAEARLGFPLPQGLRRIYEIVNGNIGPGHGLLPIVGASDTLVNVYRAFVDVTGVPAPGEPGHAQYPWPARLLPICDWGCAMWSCLDCRSADGPIVTASSGEPFTSTGHTLGSWLEAWLDGVDLFAGMFEPGPTFLNPFTKQPIQGQGKPKGKPWP